METGDEVGETIPLSREWVIMVAELIEKALRGNEELKGVALDVMEKTKGEYVAALLTWENEIT